MLKWLPKIRNCFPRQFKKMYTKVVTGRTYCVILVKIEQVQVYEINC